MLRFTLIFSLFSAFNLAAQNSYEFKTAVPPNADLVKTIDSRFFGEYTNEQTGTRYIVNAEGISIVTTIYSFITKEQVRESSKYQVRNGYLFGIIENDSVPFYLEDEKYYFGIRQKTSLNDDSHKAIIKKVSDQSYVLNFLETKGYSPSMLQFKNNTLSIAHFTYPSDTDVFNKIAKQDVNKDKNYNLVLLNPDQKEWNALDKQVIFDKELVYTKN